MEITKTFDIEQGLMLFDQWKADPDRSQALDNWLWDNIGNVFEALSHVKHLQDLTRYYCKSESSHGK